MTDVVDKKTRSRMMAGIQSKDTRPEFVIRHGLHKAGFRYRLHDARLPGKPDLVLKKYRALILINGCFWHRHNCHLFKWPGGPRAAFWREKIESNAKRDRRNIRTYVASGWRVAIIWECALKGKRRLDDNLVLQDLAEWLRGPDDYFEIPDLGENRELGTTPKGSVSPV